MRPSRNASTSRGCEGCPIPNSHRRLEQAHILWHQALDAYDDPDGFQANLNATIEALRNVTFMLQGEQDAVPGFREWYEVWRARMKADDVMMWLQEARTTVVHKADLEASSSAVATIHNNLAVFSSRLDVPPLAPTPMIAVTLWRAAPPWLQANKDLVLSVERSWRAATLPEWELLDALGHAHGLLLTLVAEAHELAGSVFEIQDDTGDVLHGADARLPCMRTSAERRTVRMSLEDGLLLERRHGRFKFDPTMIPELKKRYGDLKPVRNNDPFEFAEALLPMAKKNLVVDGAHLRLMNMRTPSGWRLWQVEYNTRAEKYSMHRLLANEARALEVDAIVDTYEAWIAPLADFRAGRTPEQSKERREVLAVSVATKDGRFRSYTTPFHRDESGAIILEETVVEDGPFPTYLAPFCELWGLPVPRG